jgi:hypothetical protein
VNGDKRGKTMTLKWEEITIEHSISLENVFELYDKSFPYEVREPHDVLLKSIQFSKNHFHFLIGFEGEKLVSFATGHYLADVNTGFIVYIATNSSVRNEGIGSKTLAQMEKQFKKDSFALGNKQLMSIVLETEKQELANTKSEREECLKRTRFFEKNGFFKTKDIFYLQPPLHEGENAVPLNLFTNNKLAKNEMIKIIHSIYKEKYFKVNGIQKDILINCLKEMGVNQ